MMLSGKVLHLEMKAYSDLQAWKKHGLSSSAQVGFDSISIISSCKACCPFYALRGMVAIPLHSASLQTVNAVQLRALPHLQERKSSSLFSLLLYYYSQQSNKTKALKNCTASKHIGMCTNRRWAISSRLWIKPQKPLSGQQLQRRRRQKRYKQQLK